MKPDFGLGSSLDDELGDPEVDVTEDDMGDDDALELAATEEVMTAMKSGDSSALRDALKAFVALCYPEE